MNVCLVCGQDFGSLFAFDAHRVGRHEYTYAEGLKRDPPVEDGRRCLDEEEMLAKGWHVDDYGRWRTGGMPQAAIAARRSGKSRPETPPPDQNPIPATKTAQA